MKKIKFILLSLILSSLTYANNDGPVVGYFGISTEDPLTVLNAAIHLMPTMSQLIYLLVLLQITKNLWIIGTAYPLAMVGQNTFQKLTP